MRTRPWTIETTEMLRRYEDKGEYVTFVLPLKFDEPCGECGKLIKARKETLGYQSEIGQRRYYCGDVCFLKHL